MCCGGPLVVGCSINTRLPNTKRKKRVSFHHCPPAQGSFSPKGEAPPPNPRRPVGPLGAVPLLPWVLTGPAVSSVFALGCHSLIFAEGP